MADWSDQVGAAWRQQPAQLTKATAPPLPPPAPQQEAAPPAPAPLRPQPIGLDLRKVVADSAHRCALWLCFVRGGRARSCGI